MSERIDGFTFFRSYLDAVLEMDDSVKLEVLTAIIAYGLDGVEPTLSTPISRAIFSIAKPNLDSSRESIIYGKKGGRPRKNPPFPENEPPPFQNSETNKNKKKNKELEEEKKKNKNKDKESIGADKPPARATFSPPSVEEVRAYCDERNNGIDPDAFVDFYTARNWMSGKTKIKDWRAAIRTWERRGRDGRVENSAVDHGQAESKWGKLQSVQLD